MKVVIPGGSGQIGTLLAREFVGRGHDVVVLSRHPTPSPWKTLQWDPFASYGPWESEIDGADVVINLAGRSVNCRYTEANRRAIINSRVESTIAVGRAIAKSSNPPSVWLQASTATIYSHRYDAPNDEEHGIIGGSERDVPDTWRFSIDVAKKWEDAMTKFETPSTRKVLMRAAMTMTPDKGGVFEVLLGMVRRRLGGTNGDGRQFVSWIHGDDFVRAIFWLIERDFSGPVNLASQNPIPNVDFMRALRRAAGISFGLSANRWMLEIGALLLQTETELLLKSRRVVPGKLLRSGFQFQFPTWPEAAQDLVQRMPSRFP